MHTTNKRFLAVLLVASAPGLAVSQTQFTITGRAEVQLPNGMFLGVANVALHGFPGPVATNQSGYYAATVPAGWTGTVVPSLDGYGFTPMGFAYPPIMWNWFDEDYVVTSVRISGTVTEAGVGLAGVTLLGFPGLPVVSQGDGSYSKWAPRGWSGTVTPILAGHAFTPASITYPWVYQPHFDQDYIGTMLGLTAAATAYGAGCGSPPLRLVPDASHRPVIGQTAGATIVDAPSLVAGVAMGWSNQQIGPFMLPVTLAGTGSPGCPILQSTEIIGLGATSTGPTTLAFALTIPPVSILIGSHWYIQAYAFAPGANPLQITTSNGIDWLIGDL